MTASKAGTAEGGSSWFRIGTLANRGETDRFPVGESEEALSDDAFEILRNARRRYALRILAGREGAVELTDLASTIAAVENGKPPDEVDETERKRVYISLYQSHISRMTEAGVVEYDEESRSVSITPRGTELTAALEALVARDGRHTRAYLGITVVALVLSTAAFYSSMVEPAMLLLGVGLSFLAMVLVFEGRDLLVRILPSRVR